MKHRKMSMQGLVNVEVPRFGRNVPSPIDLFLHLPPKPPTLASTLDDFLVGKLTNFKNYFLFRLLIRH